MRELIGCAVSRATLACCAASLFYPTNGRAGAPRGSRPFNTKIKKLFLVSLRKCCKFGLDMNAKEVSNIFHRLLYRKNENIKIYCRKFLCFCFYNITEFRTST